MSNRTRKITPEIYKQVKTLKNNKVKVDTIIALLADGKPPVKVSKDTIYMIGRSTNYKAYFIGLKQDRERFKKGVNPPKRTIPLINKQPTRLVVKDKRTSADKRKAIMRDISVADTIYSLSKRKEDTIGQLLASNPRKPRVLKKPSTKMLVNHLLSRVSLLENHARQNWWQRLFTRYPRSHYFDSSQNSSQHYIDGK